MPDRVKWSICKVEGEDPPQYAILPNDRTKGLLVGDRYALVDVHGLLDRFFKGYAQSVDTIPADHEQLGFEWITIRRVRHDYTIPHSTVKTACQDGRIKGAEKNQWGEWTFSRMAFYAWYQKHKEETRGRR